MPAPEPEQLDRFHRWFAVECNNLAWALTAKANRTAAEDDDMLRAAYAAAFHWSQVGKPIHFARADSALAAAHAALGRGQDAMRHATRYLTYCLAEPCEDWDLAFAHAGVAHAALLTGDAQRHAEHYRQAQTIGSRILDAEDRHIFLQEFERIPKPM